MAYSNLSPGINALYGPYGYSGNFNSGGNNSYELDAIRKQLEQLAASGSKQGSGMYQDPFGSAMSGTQKGTLQPYVNRMTQNASNALYGGLLGYRPQSMIAGNAGGTPVNSTVPNWRLPSAIPTPNQGQVGLLGAQANPQQQMGIFGNRSWMAA